MGVPSPDNGRTTGARRRLVQCSRCNQDAVAPLTWDEHDDHSWWIVLRCGNCQLLREGVFSDEVCEQFGEDLEAHTVMISQACELMRRRRMISDIHSFASAFRADAIAPSDFDF